MAITIDDELGEAALRAAAKAGFPSVVEGLINAGVDPNALFGAALVIAERYGDTETIELLRSKTTPIVELFRRDQSPARREPTPITIDEELGEAALRAAAKAGFPSVAEGLIKADVNPDALLGAALLIAEQYGDAETIELLRSKTTPVVELFRRAGLSLSPP